VGGLILVVLWRFYLELVVFFLLLVVFFLGFRIGLRLLFLLLLVLVVLPVLVRALELVLGTREPLIHLLDAFTDLCDLVLVDLGLEVVLDHLRVLGPLVDEGLRPAFGNVLGPRTFHALVELALEGDLHGLVGDLDPFVLLLDLVVLLAVLLDLVEVHRPTHLSHLRQLTFLLLQ
jgi:hypothetical protein